VGSRPAIEVQVIVGLLSKFYNKDLVLIEASSGGGEVSGGGTLYMKWGAGLFGLRRERECVSG
jgi:hypothetical protein